MYSPDAGIFFRSNSFLTSSLENKKGLIIDEANSVLKKKSSIHSFTLIILLL